MAGTGLVGVRADPLQGQEIRAVGLIIARVRSEEVWTPDAPTSPRDGWGMGAFVDVALPAPVLSVVAEGSLVQRGTRLSVGVGDFSGEAEVESDYLSFPLLLKLRYFREPLGAYVVAGAAVEYLLRSRFDPGLAQVYGREKPVVGSGVLGAGVEGLAAGRVALGVEARIVEAFGKAYEGDIADVRHRSFEILLRLGLRPPTERPAR